MQHGTNYGSTAASQGESETVSFDPLRYSRVILFTCFLCLIILAEGYDFGVLNGAMVRIKDDFQISNFEISLLVTVTPLHVIPGSALGGVLADMIGRRAAIRVTCLVLTVGPLGMALAPSIYLLLATRAIVGLGIGMGFVVIAMYISELAPSELRGRLTSLEDIFLNFGMVGGYLVNWLLLGMPHDWRWMLGLGSVLPLLVGLMICLPQMPESPRWLFSKGRREEAEAVLSMFVGQDEVQRDMQAMAEQSAESQELATWHDLISAWHEDKTRRMLISGVVVAVAQVGGGYLFFSYYSSTVLKNWMDEETAFKITVFMGIVKLFMGLLTVAVLEHVGRRPMLLISATICTFACAWLALAFQGTVAIFGAKALGFAAFMGGISLGLGPITVVYVAEVFGTKWRGKAMALAFLVSRIIGVASTVTFPLLMDIIGISKTFWILCLANVLMLVLIWIFVAETHGKSLERMGEIFDEAPTTDLQDMKKA